MDVSYVYMYVICKLTESYMQAVGNPVTPRLRAIAQHNEAESDFHKQQQGVRASFGKGFFRTKNEPRSSSEPNLSMCFNRNQLLLFCWHTLQLSLIKVYEHFEMLSKTRNKKKNYQ